MIRNIVRCLCPLLALILVFTFAAEPVTAAEGKSYIELLNYNQVTDYGNFFYFSGTYNVSLTMPSQSNVFSVDLLFVSNSSISSITSTFDGNTSTLTIVSLGSKLYRAYGSVYSGNYNSINFLFTGNDTEYITLLSCRVWLSSVSSFLQNTTIEISNNDGTNNSVQYYTGSSTQYVKVPSDVSQNNQFVVYLYPRNFSDWKKFDFWDVQLFMQVGEIDSVSAVMGDINLPIEYNYLNDASVALSEYYVTVSVDLRDLIRTSSDYPMIIITGSYFTGQNRISMFGSTGSVAVADLDPQYIYFRDLQEKLESLFSAQNQYINDLKGVTQAINNAQVAFYQSVGDVIKSSLPRIETLLGYIDTGIEMVRQVVENRIIDLRDTLSEKFQTEIDRLIEVIQGDSSKTEELDQSSSQIQNDVQDSHQFEQDQQAVLDNNFTEIQSAVSVTNFAAALAFVQGYSNQIFYGLGKVVIIFTMPLFLGLFFYVCSRTPGNTVPWLKNKVRSAQKAKARSNGVKK